MAWVRLSDDFYDHPKFDKAGVLGIALFAAGLAWCNRNLSDGFIPRKKALGLLDFEDVVEALVEADRNAVTDVTDNEVLALSVARIATKRLVDSGLWHAEDGGFRVHNYLAYQASKEQVEAGRSSNAARQKAWRERRKAEKEALEKAENNGGRNGVTNAPVTGPPTPTPREVLRTSPSDSPSEEPGNEREDVERVCAHLRQRVIDGGKPAHRVKITKDWRTAARLLMDRDGVTEEQVHAAIDWVQDHDFWNSRVRAMPKLREKYFELRDQAVRDKGRQQAKATTSMASQRTAAKCSEHSLSLPCSSCLGDIRAGDTEVPRRLLAEHGHTARPDLAEHLNSNGAAA